VDCNVRSNVRLLTPFFTASVTRISICCLPSAPVDRRCSIPPPWPWSPAARPPRARAEGIAAYCRPENKVSLGFVEGLNNKIRVLQRRAYGLRDEEYLRLKILTRMLPTL
jgi:hypothetical protein